MSRMRRHGPADDPASRVIRIDAVNAGPLGKVFAELKRDLRPTLLRALGMQVRNVQKSIAATVKNYAITANVGGKRETIEQFAPRHEITVALHGKKSDSALSKPKSVFITANADGNGFVIGYKGRMVPYAQRWQDGGDTGLQDDRGALAMLACKRDIGAVRSRLGSPEVRREIYRRLGSEYGIHDRAAIDATIDDAIGQGSDGRPSLQGAGRAVIVRLLNDDAASLVGDVPATWEGRPFMDKLADRVKERFIPSLLSIVDKMLDGRIKAMQKKGVA